MNWISLISRAWQRCVVALLIVAVASAIRAPFFGGPERGIPHAV